MIDVVDVRSDTVTKPSPEMLAAMMETKVGDDVFGEDETVNALQQTAADLFGMEAALFCPSGTMTNQIGIRLHTRPGDEVICDELAHVYLSEGGGIAANSGCSTRLLQGHNGRFTAEQVRDKINRRDSSNLPWTRVVAIENTVNKGGGCCWNLEEIIRIRTVCDEHALALHLDGARIFNAIVANNETPVAYGRLFDTISICLSKGLGAPVGSLLLGSRDVIAKAHRLRKLMGGGMRQAGYLAAAGLYALRNNVTRLRKDHAKAHVLGAELSALPYVAEVLPVETNIVICRLATGLTAEALLDALRGHGVRASTLGRQTVRFVFHLDVSDAQLDALVDAVRRVRITA
jgi:threonine aldolase